MNKKERQHLVSIVDLCQKCHLELGNFLVRHDEMCSAPSGSILQQHLAEQNEGVLENLLVLQNRLGNSFQSLEGQIALGFFERTQEVFNSFRQQESTIDFEYGP